MHPFTNVIINFTCIDGYLGGMVPTADELVSWLERCALWFGSFADVCGVFFCYSLHLKWNYFQVDSRSRNTKQEPAEQENEVNANM